MPSNQNNNELVVQSTAELANTAVNVAGQSLNVITNAVSSTANAVSNDVKEVITAMLDCRNKYLEISKEIEICHTNANVSLEKIRKEYKLKKSALADLSSMVKNLNKNIENVDITTLDEKQSENYKFAVSGLMRLADNITSLYNTLD